MIKSVSLSIEKGRKMKLLTAVILVAGLALGAAYAGGVFDAELSVTLNPEVKDDIAELTYDTLNKAQESTDRAFKALKDKLEENNEHGK